jgi:hypothetical protein
MKKTQLNIDNLVVESFDTGSRALAADAFATGATCRIGCSYVTCYAGCETNDQGAC